MQSVILLSRRQAPVRFTFLNYIIPSALFIAFFIQVLDIKAQTYPTGFNQVLVANGITSPTVMAFAPDGRLFVAQQSGALRIIENGILLSTPFVTLTVNSSGERGLLGIAFDPSFTTNKFIYLYYTLSSGANNRISRFTANGNVVVPGSEVVILNLDPLSTATNHNGGTIQFGLDGKLYVGVGENANSANAPNLDTYLGKILRINPDGSVPTGNPFTSGTAQKQRIWQYGLRNPYTLSIHPVTGRIFVNDVGQNTWEEINDCTTGGRNYGWPTAEGTSSNTAFTNPVYSYTHGSGIGLGCAITGGTFFNPATTNYPSQYSGRYFFLDYCNNWIDMLTLSGTTGTRSNFASVIAGSPVCMTTGPDGNLYFLSRSNSAVYKITYTSSSAPVITNHPQNITVSEGNSASFSVTATGSATLAYQWRKNTVNITGANSANYTIPSVVPSSAGSYSVVVSNTAGSVTSNNGVLTVTTANKLPTATINTPLAGASYTAGTSINFSGSATDPENGNLLAPAFTWFVEFRHDAHIHPGPATPSGVTSGTFTIPNTGETSSNVFYRLYLVVTDSQGGKDTAYTDIIPRKSTIIISTNPSGLQVTLDGQPFTAPITVISVEGMLRTIGAPSPQGNYTFNSWSQGGSASQTITTPVNDSIYTAKYLSSTISTLSPLADAYVIGGKNTNYGASTTLVTQKNSSQNKTYETYLKFDISSFSTTISSAVLRLNGKLNNTQTSLIPVGVYNSTNTTWLENTINWNNKPVAQTTLLATASVSGTSNQYYQWDLTQHIKNLRTSGIKTMTLKLVNTNPTSNQAVFNAKESTSNRPQLVVTSPSTTFAIQSTESKENYNRPWSINIYPNPVKNNLIIQNSSESGPMKIFDLSGRLVKESFISANSTQQVPVDDLINGLYIIRIQNEKGVLTKKFVLKK